MALKAINAVCFGRAYDWQFECYVRASSRLIPLDISDAPAELDESAPAGASHCVG